MTPPSPLAKSTRPAGLAHAEDAHRAVVGRPHRRRIVLVHRQPRVADVGLALDRLLARQERVGRLLVAQRRLRRAAGGEVATQTDRPEIVPHGVALLPCDYDRGSARQIYPGAFSSAPPRDRLERNGAPRRTNPPRT